MSFKDLAGKAKEEAYKEGGGSFLLEDKKVYKAYISDWTWNSKFQSLNIKLDVEVGDKEYKTAFSTMKFGEGQKDEQIQKLFNRVELLGVADLVDYDKASLELVGMSVMDAMNRKTEKIKTTRYNFYCSHYTKQDGSTGQSMSLVFQSDETKPTATATKPHFDKIDEVSFFLVCDEQLPF